MPFISVTRLRVRSIRFLPWFALQTTQTLRQVRRAQGFQDGSLLPDHEWTFWTMTLWDGEEDMRRYILAGPHKKAMPKLMDWCDEASIVHWNQEDGTLPSWTEADRRMRAEGRVSKVRNPSAQHTGMTFREPRLTRAAPIRRA